MSEGQTTTSIIPAAEALRLGSMVIDHNPQFGLFFYSPTTPHGCALAAMLYAVGVRDHIEAQDVAEVAIARWPFQGNEIDEPEAVTRNSSGFALGTVAGAIEDLAFSGLTYNQIADWLEPIENAQRELRIAELYGSDKLRAIGEQWHARRTTRTAHGLPARSYEAAASAGSRING